MSEGKKKINGVIPKEEREKLREYQERHEDSLLKILIEKKPDKARKFLREIEAKAI